MQSQWTIPGTILQIQRSDAARVDGLFQSMFLTGGLSLSQISSISGLEPYTVQNWVKRGFLVAPKHKKYDMNQVAHILIINMLRSCMQLDKIAFLIQYINGKVDDRSDDIIEDSVLYDYICKILDRLVSYDVCSIGSVKEEIATATADYTEKFPGARERLTNALEIIVVAYYAAIIKKYSDSKLDEILN